MDRGDALLIAANVVKEKARRVARETATTSLEDAVRLAQVYDTIMYGVREANKPSQIEDNRRALAKGIY